MPGRTTFMGMLALLLTAGAARSTQAEGAAGQADWVIEQEGQYGSRIRKVIGKSNYKMTWWERGALKGDLIADFAADVVTQVDYEKKTVARIGLEEFLKRETASFPPHVYSLYDRGRYAGLECQKYSYSYSSGAKVTGGWGGGRGCYTQAIGVAAPYGKKFARWLQATEGYTGNLGIPLWYEAQVAGPWGVALQTVSAIHRPVPAREFQAPAGYQAVEFKRW